MKNDAPGGVPGKTVSGEEACEAVLAERYRLLMTEGLESAEKLAVQELEKGLHLHHHLSPRRERAMFASLGFFVALAVTRGVTTYLHYHGAGANGGIIIDGVHVHHEAFGIIGLVVLGYGWLLLYGFEPAPKRRWFRITGLVYGICTALILDEFALWLNLRDVYWQKQGRESVEALALFAGFLLWAVLIAPFARAVWRHFRAKGAS